MRYNVNYSANIWYIEASTPDEAEEKARALFFEGQWDLCDVNVTEYESDKAVRQFCLLN